MLHGFMRTASNHKKYFWAILLTFLFTTLSGAMRKWGVSSGVVSNAILGIQLLVPFGLVGLFPQKKIKSRFIPVLVVYGLILVGLAFNPLNQTYLHGVFGFILHFGFWLALFAYLSQRNKFQLSSQLNKYLLLLVIAQIVLALIQYRLPSTHFLNRYVSETDFIAGVGDAVRVTGTFSYISGFSAFLIFVGMFAWAMAVQKRISSLAIIGLLGGLLIASLMNGSRATLAMSLFFVGVTGLQLFSIKNIPALFATLVMIIILISLNVGTVATVATEAYDNFLTRVEGNAESGEQTKRIIGPVSEIVDFKGEYPLFGVGLGATYQGANALFGTSHFLRSYGFFEEEPERIILEGGFLLFLCRIILLGLIVSYLKIPKVYSIPLFILMFLYVPFIFNIYNLYYFMLGLILLDYSYNERHSSKKRAGWIKN